MRYRKLKQALSLILCTLLILAPTVTASAETVASGECGDGVLWTLDDTGLLRISGTGVIPDYGIIVTVTDPDNNIAESTDNGFAPWYEYRDQVTALEIGSGITAIGQEAFQVMEKLQSVSFPVDVKSIGTRAFRGCLALKEVSFPAGMTTLGEESFSNCQALKTVTMPYGLTDIGLGVFSYCSALESVTLPGDLTSVPGRMFESTFAIKHIDIPNGVTTIEGKAFYGSKLESITLPKGLQILGDEAFQGTLLSSIDLPDSLEWIGERCFFGCGELTSVKIPDKISSLTWAFSGCIKLKEVKLPTNIKTMYAAFSGCSALESMGLPEGLESIQNECFENCGLKEITFPTTLREITANSFSGCNHLEKITFLGNAPTQISENAFEKVTATVYYPKRNSSWTNDIRQNYGGTLTWVTFDGGVQQDGYLVFSGLPKTIAVEIDGVSYVPDQNGDVFVPTKDAKLAFYYEYNKLDGDIHEQYPVNMQVALLTYTDEGYQADLPSPLQGTLHYAGSSIRITGKKGIRMITGINTQEREKLMEGREGYTLLEYGTVVAWDSELKGTVLTLEHPAAKTAFAYKKGEADPVFKVVNGDTQFTNVLVGFSNDQCVPDLSMRPYMKLQDKDGNVLTVYGGTVHRSIGYIALQNRKAFQPGTDSYEYIWGIIHFVYGTKYDADYKK